MIELEGRQFKQLHVDQSECFDLVRTTLKLTGYDGNVYLLQDVNDQRVTIYAKKHIETNNYERVF